LYKRRVVVTLSGAVSVQTKVTQFSNWLTCQYPHLSARKLTMSFLALFFYL
jgi:hypothetical protein